MITNNIYEPVDPIIINITSDDSDVEDDDVVLTSDDELILYAVATEYYITGRANLIFYAVGLRKILI